VKYGLTILLIAMSCALSAEEEFAVDDFIAASLEGLQMQTEGHDKTWGIGSAETWSVDQDAGEISWLFADGRRAVAAVQIIGTYNPGDNTFMWGWGHPSVNQALQTHARLVREFGEENSIPRLVTQKVVISGEAEAWEFVAIANRLAESNGGYRGDAGGPIVFMTFGEITLHKEPLE